MSEDACCLNCNVNQSFGASSLNLQPKVICWSLCVGGALYDQSNLSWRPQFDHDPAAFLSHGIQNRIFGFLFYWKSRLWRRFRFFFCFLMALYRSHSKMLVRWWKKRETTTYWAVVSFRNAMSFLFDFHPLPIKSDDRQWTTNYPLNNVKVTTSN